MGPRIPAPRATLAPIHARRRRQRYDDRIPFIRRSERVRAVVLDCPIAAPPTPGAERDQQSESEDEAADRNEQPRARKRALVLDVARRERTAVAAEDAGGDARVTGRRPRVDEPAVGVSVREGLERQVEHRGWNGLVLAVRVERDLDPDLIGERPHDLVASR